MIRLWRAAVLGAMAASLGVAAAAVLATSRGVAQDAAWGSADGPKGGVCQAMAAVLRDGYHWNSKDGRKLPRPPKLSLAVADPASQPDCDWAAFGLDVAYSFGPDNQAPGKPGLGYVDCPGFRSKVGCTREPLGQARGFSFSKPRVAPGGGQIAFEVDSQCGWAMCGDEMSWTVTRKSDGSWSPAGEAGWIN